MAITSPAIEDYKKGTEEEETRYYQWTRDPLKDGVDVPMSNPPARYRYLDAVVLHEFSHTFGGKHYPGSGVFDGSSSTITSNDRGRLEDIYGAHTRNYGW